MHVFGPRLFLSLPAPSGALREIKLGEFGDALTLAGARKLCDKSASSVMGRERQAAKQAAYTVADMVEDYIRE